MTVKLAKLREIIIKHNSSCGATGEQILYIIKYGRNLLKCQLRKRSQVIKKMLTPLNDYSLFL